MQILIYLKVFLEFQKIKINNKKYFKKNQIINKMKKLNSCNNLILITLINNQQNKLN